MHGGRGGSRGRSGSRDWRTGATAGYIPRHLAARYQTPAGTLGGVPLAAELIGGTVSKPSIGVVFNGQPLLDAAGEKRPPSPADQIVRHGCGCVVVILFGMFALFVAAGLMAT